MKKHFTILSILLGLSNLTISQYVQNFDVTQIRSFGGTGLEISGDMTLDSQGNQYILGRFRGDFNDGGSVNYTSNGTDELFLQKADLNGSIIWTKLVVDDNSSLSPAKVAIDSDDNVYVFFSGARNQVTIDTMGINLRLNVPVMAGVPANGLDFFLWKINANGNTAWAKTFGGNMHDNAKSIIIDHNDNIIITGNFLYKANFQPDLGPNDSLITNQSFILSTGSSSNNGYDGFVAKLDSSGQAIWTTQIGGSLAPEMVLDAAVDSQNNILIAGWTESQDFTFPTIGTSHISAFRDGFVGKLDANGNGLSVSYVSGTDHGDECTNITVDESDNVFVSVTTQSSTLSLGGANYSSLGGLDALLVKYSSSLTHEWHLPIASAGNDRINDITVSNSQDVYAVGSVQGVVNQNGSTYGFSGASSDAFVLSVNTTGTYNHFSVTGNVGVEAVQDLEIHSDGSIFIYGESEANVPFIIGPDTVLLSNQGNRDVFVVKGFDCTGFGLGGELLMNTGSSLTVNASSNFTFDWLFDDGSVISYYLMSGGSQISLPSDSGYYAVVVSNEYCSDTSNYVWVSEPTLSIAPEKVAQNIRMYPNPTKEHLNFQTIDNSTIQSISVSNVIGEQCVYHVCNNQSSIINLPLNLSSGIYLVQITTSKALITKQLYIE